LLNVVIQLKARDPKIILRAIGTGDRLQYRRYSRCCLNQQTGLLVPPHDSLGLEKAIVTLAEDISLRRRLGEKSRRWIEQRFSIEKYNRMVEHIYKELAFS